MQEAEIVNQSILSVFTMKYHGQCHYRCMNAFGLMKVSESKGPLSALTSLTAFIHC